MKDKSKLTDFFFNPLIAPLASLCELCRLYPGVNPIKLEILQNY